MRRPAKHLPLGLACLALATSCGPSAAPQERRIVPHKVPGCDVTLNSGLLLTPLGDFADSPVSLQEPQKQNEILLPFNLRGVSTASTFVRGVGYADPPDDVHLSLWSSNESCTPIVDEVSPSQGGHAMTAFADGNAVILAGLDPAPGGLSKDSALAFVWDTRTGEKLAPTGGLGANRRAYASATAFGKGALVAGGIDVDPDGEGGIASALVFRDGAFQPQKIPLDIPRARHGATVLADGSTLLVGGESTNHVALPSMVAVLPTNDPPFGRAIIFELGTLSASRKSPTVLRLADDRILVAGGTDNEGQPVTTLEWFTKDAFACGAADKCPPVQSLPARFNRAFVALPAGGALAVGIDIVVDPATKQMKVISDVWWIPRKGDPVALAPLGGSQLPELDNTQLRTKNNLRLVPAADGSPWLWTGKAWFRFDPWQEKFVLPDSSAPSSGPDKDLPIIAVDPGLMVWLQREPAAEADAGADAGADADAGVNADAEAGADTGADASTSAGPAKLVTKVRGFRYDVRGPLARDTTFFLDSTFLLSDHAKHIVPDRPSGKEIRIENDGLHVSNDARAVVADALYGDVIIKGTTHSTSLPGIILGSSFVVGEDPCPWTPSTGADAGVIAEGGTAMSLPTDRSFEVRRTGTSLQLKIDGVTNKTLCGGPEGRVPIGLTGLGSTPAIVSELTVTRVAPP